ncbi:MAG TPA: lysozyme inhibitor LprI family protein [Patescibacteria group bacterium]|nr:lysozyme inhibitor LprI family protein [Patescibacteria group bacterium]
MKKYLIAVLVSTLILTSCASVPDKEVSNNSPTEIKQAEQSSSITSMAKSEGTIDNSYFGQYQMSDEGFSMYVQDNVIDKNYEAETTQFQQSNEFSTQGWIALESKYIEIWDNELNNIYNKLLEKLNEKEQKELREAQKGWLQYHIKESEFVVESWNDLGLGSQGKVQLSMSQKARIRQRTLQLMEYYFMVGGDVEFSYKGE